MTRDELKQAAIDCLGKVFTGDTVDVQVVQAAVAIVLAPDTTASFKKRD